MFRTLLPAVLAAMLAISACSKSSPPGTASGGEKERQGIALELEPCPEGFPLGLSVSEGFAIHMFESPDPNLGFRKLPPETGFKRYYDQFTIAGKPHLLVTEESSPPRLYFDENRNGDLTDDRAPIPGEGPAVVPNHYSIRIRYDDEKVVAPYRFWMFASNMGGVRFYPACHWRGSLTVNDKQFNLVAFDSDSDGDYSNNPLVIDVDGNGAADPGESLLPGRSIDLDGTTVTFVSISSSGLTVRIRM